MTTADGSRLELRDSKAFWGTVAVATGALALASSGTGLGPFGLVLFGGYATWAVSRLLHRPVRLAVNAQGIVDRTFWFSPGLIPWSEIVDVRPGRFGFIDIELRDEAAFMERLPPLRRLARWKFALYGLGPAAMNPWPLPASRREIVEALESGLDAFILEDVDRIRPLDGLSEAPA